MTEHQVMDALFRRALPPTWNLTMLLLLAAAIVSKGKSRWLFGLAAAIFLFSLIVTIRVEVPMNRAIALWNPDAAPANWEAVRDRWLSFHLARTTGGLIAFVCSVAALMLRRER